MAKIAAVTRVSIAAPVHVSDEINLDERHYAGLEPVYNEPYESRPVPIEGNIQPHDDANYENEFHDASYENAHRHNDVVVVHTYESVT